MQSQILRRLTELNAASRADEMDQLGFDFHRLHGKPVRYSVHVNGHGVSRSNSMVVMPFASISNNTTEVRYCGP
jgi:hypothetical protein